MSSGNSFVRQAISRFDETKLEESPKSFTPFPRTVAQASPRTVAQASPRPVAQPWPKPVAEPWPKSVASSPPVASPPLATPPSSSSSKNVVKTVPKSFPKDPTEFTRNMNDAQARTLLRDMVRDLLGEVDILRQRLAETETKLRESRAEVKQLDLSAAFNVQTLNQTSSGTNSAPRVADPHDAARTEALIEALRNATKTTDIPELSAQDVSSEEATELVIHSLLENVRRTAQDNESLTKKNDALQDKVWDLTAENEVHELKIAALETHFKTINKSRQGIVTRLTNKSKQGLANGSPTAAGTSAAKGS